MDGYSSQEPPLSEGEYNDLVKEIPFLENMGLLLEDRKFLNTYAPSECGSQLPEVVHQHDEVDRRHEVFVHQLTEFNPMETMNVPSPTCEIPCDKEWDGMYNFDILVDGITSSKKTWLYSHLLGKVFIDAFQHLPLQFKIDNKGPSDMLCVRALPVYSVAQYKSSPVSRCPVHVKDDQSKGKLNINHVVQCSDHYASYEYDEVSKRHSVVVPLRNPPAGSDATTLMFTLACKTSCLGGMNRRPIMIIFTLERNQQVVGRKVIHIRICSCPKRDKLKEEELHLLKDCPQSGPGRKEKSSRCPEPKAKKPRYNATEEMGAQPEFNIKVHGMHDYKKTLEYLIMLKLREHDRTKSEEALRCKEEYERLLSLIHKPSSQ